MIFFDNVYYFIFILFRLECQGETKAVVAPHHGVVFHHLVLSVEEVEHLHLYLQFAVAQIERAAKGNALVGIACNTAG